MTFEKLSNMIRDIVHQYEYEDKTSSLMRMIEQEIKYCDDSVHFAKYIGKDEDGQLKFDIGSDFGSFIIYC